MFGARQHTRGFTLIQMAVIIAVLGITIGVGLESRMALINMDRVNATKNRIRHINEAILKYRVQNGYYPGPADRTLLQDTASFGRVTDCTAAIPITGGVVSVAGDTVRIGAVPVRDLNLPTEYAADGWDDKLLYAVTKSLCIAAQFSAGTGAVIIDEGDGAAPYTTSTAAYVILSHGKDKKGAVLLDGTAIGTACTPAAEKDSENCDYNDAVFTDMAYQDYDHSNTTTYFDDILQWSLKQ